ncbi:MAG: hypothetical protein OEY49_13130 [Candidatus Heimdallarchaeota archaeon]|nr:hypothetical protein [Candidatus Heimdallarchaeota archaeon]
METDNLSSNDFIEEWLNHLNLHYLIDYADENSNNQLDFYLPHHNIGILISKWKKPISVKVINKAVQLRQKLDLNEIIIIVKDISPHAKEVIDRLENELNIIHPMELSWLALKFLNIKDVKIDLIN